MTHRLYDSFFDDNNVGILNDNAEVSKTHNILLLIYLITYKYKMKQRILILKN